MGRIDRAIYKEFQKEIEEGSLIIMRFVDDYLILKKSSISNDKVVEVFNRNKLSLDFTVEVQDVESKSLQFLDVLVIADKKGICYRNQQRKAKDILPFSSNHTRSVKVGVVKGLVRSSVLKSCRHETQKSLDIQVARLVKAGYKSSFVMQQIRSLSLSIGVAKTEFNPGMPVVGIQQCHDFTNVMKKLARSFNVMIVSKYENSLGTLPAKVDGEKEKCGKSGHSKDVECVDNVIYNLPLTCNKAYIGQTQRCINTRLYEHRKSITEDVSSSLKQHTMACKNCKPLFEKTTILGRSGNRTVREVVEAAYIDRNKAISKPSRNVSQEEVTFILD
jgi:hypothetical protein